MAKKKSILFILDYYYPHTGGVEILFQTLCEHLVTTGYSVTVLTQVSDSAKLQQTHNGVKIVRVNTFGSRFLFPILGYKPALKLAKSADIIHTSTFASAPLASRVGKKLGKKVILTSHEVWIKQWSKLTDFSFFKARFYDFLERLIYRSHYDTFIAVSESTRSQLVSIGKKKEDITVIHNGVDYEHWKPNPAKSSSIRVSLELQGKYIVLAYGRPGTSKGLQYFVESIPHVLRNISNAHFVLIMSKSSVYKKERSRILRLIEKLGVSNKITILPPQKYADLPAYVGMADCAVVPSLAEGFGFNAAEICALGVPLVATRTTSLPEVVSGKYVLVTPRSSSAIAEGVLAVHSKNYTLETLKRFTISEQMAKYDDFYEELFSK